MIFYTKNTIKLDMFAVILIFLLICLKDISNFRDWRFTDIFRRLFISYVLFCIFVVIYMYTEFSIMGQYLFL